MNVMKYAVRAQANLHDLSNTTTKHFYATTLQVQINTAQTEFGLYDNIIWILLKFNPRQTTRLQPP